MRAALCAPPCQQSRARWGSGSVKRKMTALTRGRRAPSREDAFSLKGLNENVTAAQTDEGTRFSRTATLAILSFKPKLRGTIS